MNVTIRGLTAIVCLAMIATPQAHADDWLRWDQLVEPQGPTAAAPSVDYNAPRTYPPAGMPGTFQVYATPPGVHVIPSADTYCGTTLSQAQIPDRCRPAVEAGWDMWFR